MTNLDYLYNKDDAKERFERNCFVGKKLGFQTINNGIIIPHIKTDKTGYWGVSGVIDEQGVFKKEIIAMQDVETSALLNGNVKKSKGTVICLGLFAPAWGHNITINLGRLWFLKNALYKKYFKRCRIVYMPWYKTWDECEHIYIDQIQNLGRLLEILDIDPNILQPIEEPTQFDRVILPDSSFYEKEYTFYFTKEYKDTIERIRDFAIKNRTPTPSNKVYYFYGRHQIGEEYLADYFQSKGYMSVKPETLTLDEQLNLMINCDSFAATLGSCAHNSIFLREGTEAIFIPRDATTFKITKYQQAIDQARNLNVTYVDSSLSMFGKVHESYCYIVSRQLKRFFDEESLDYTEKDFTTFFEYLKDSMIRKREIHPEARQYYGKVFRDFFMQMWNRQSSEYFAI